MQKLSYLYHEKSLSISRHFVSGNFEKGTWAVHASREYHPQKNWVQKELKRDYLGCKAYMGDSLSLDNLLVVISSLSASELT